MKTFIKQILLVCLACIFWALQAKSQTIHLELRDGKLSVDRKQWTFKLAARGDALYTSANNGDDWSTMDIRFDIPLPSDAADTKLSDPPGSAVVNGSYLANLVVQNNYPGPTLPNNLKLALFLTRDVDADNDLSTTDFIELATVTVNFTREVSPTYIANPRLNTTVTGSFWTNLADPGLGRPFSASGTALPVKLIHFTGVQESGTVQLNWSTSEEASSDRFEIERSADGVTWQRIGTQRAAGYASTRTDYRFSDITHRVRDNYYRLKMIDLDGSFAYSKIIVIKAANDLIGVAFPNPASDILKIRADLIPLVKKIEVHAASGNAARTLALNGQGQVDLKNLDNGIYIFQFHFADGSNSSQHIAINR